jgi:hypothetical protein
VQTLEFHFFFNPLWFGDAPLGGSQSSIVTATAAVTFATSKRETGEYQVSQSTEVVIAKQEETVRNM